MLGARGDLAAPARPPRRACSRGIPYSISVNLIRRSRGEDPVAAVDLGRAPDAGGGEPREPRDLRGQAARGERERAADPVLEHHLLGVDERRGRGRGGSSVRRLSRQSAVSRVREDVELEVVVGRVELVEALERLVERPRAVDAVEPCTPGRSARSPRRRARARRGRSARPRAQPGRRSPRSRASCRRRAPARPPRPGPRRCETALPVPWVPVEIEPASVWRSMSPRFSNASPSSSRRRLRSPRTIPASTLTSPDARVDVEHAVEAVAADHHPVGERDRR